MRARKRGAGDKNIHRRSALYQENVWRKITAYHRFIQLGCIAQGLLQHLTIHFRPMVWDRFRSWLRTMDPTLPPS